MPTMKEKRLRLPGIELAAAIDARRAERIASSPLWRYLVKSPMRMVRRIRSKPAVNGNGRPQLVTKLSENQESRPTAVVDDPQAAALREKIKDVYWYHTIDLGHGVVTPGLVDNRSEVDLGLPADLTGKRCLDIGTFDGFWAYEMERRGAAEVVALDLNSLEDVDLRPRSRQRWIDEVITARGSTALGEAFQIVHDIRDSKVQRKILSVYELSPDKIGMFDFVYFGDIIVHLRDPQLAIENIFSVTRGAAHIASAFDPDLDQSGEPLMKVHPSSGDFIWWSFSSASLKKMMELAGFDPVEEAAKYHVNNRVGRFWKVVWRGHAPAGAE